MFVFCSFFCSSFVRLLFVFCSSFVRLLFVFCSSFVRQKSIKVKQYKIIETRIDGLYPSDHLPVWVELQLK
ncbi:hypothetical protein HMPREF1321_1744 [Capnocytophaga sp. oral taxon 412 str. F0487]|nr:hypothetical protein HMPREF1321_1744 [Capnocytophaga sp. oral taxon 412 str. F0487]